MDKKWPLHPKPKEHQLVYEWVTDLAALYEINYQTFCKKVLKLTNEEIYDLRSNAPVAVLTILANATGIAIEELKGRDMNSRFKKWKEEYEEKLKQDNEEQFV